MPSISREVSRSRRASAASGETNLYTPPRSELLIVAEPGRVRADLFRAMHTDETCVPESLAAVEKLLRRHGKPMTRTELIATLGASTQTIFYVMLGQRPFVELYSQVWGLIDRDVPGGDAAFDEALALLRPSWSRCSAITEEAVEAVRALSAHHRSWSRDTIVSAIRCARRQS